VRLRGELRILEKEEKRHAELLRIAQLELSQSHEVKKRAGWGTWTCPALLPPAAAAAAAAAASAASATALDVDADDEEEIQIPCFEGDGSEGE